MRDVTQHSAYGGWTIWTRNYCGMWKATRYDKGSLPLAADAFARESTYQSARTTRPNIDADYAAYLHSQYLAACDATHSYMVSDAGKAKGYQSSDFFKVGRRPSAERWGSDELRAWLGSVNAAQGDITAMGKVLSKTEYARLTSERRPEGVAA